MAFIEMSGKTLFRLLNPDELNADELRATGVGDESLVRINRQGDIELRTKNGWEVIGGLLGDFENRVRQQTGLDWA